MAGRCEATHGAAGCGPSPSAAARERVCATALLGRLWLGDDAAGHVRRFLPCSRCGEGFSDSRCQVEHPVHLRLNCGSILAANTVKTRFRCRACKASYVVVSPLLPTGGASYVEGRRWCYEGPHETAPLSPSDPRRVVAGVRAVRAGAGLQRDIDALPRDTSNLTVYYLQGNEGQFPAPRLGDAPLPALRSLRLLDVAFASIDLTDRSAPLLRRLELQHCASRACLLNVRAPLLRDVSIRSVDQPADVINALLAAATNLERFEADELRVSDGGAVNFASARLRVVSFHRTPALPALSLWAPALERLELRVCYGVDRIDVLDTHALAVAAAEAPPPTTGIAVVLDNSLLGAAARAALVDHPRFAVSKDDFGYADDDEAP